MFCSGNFHNSRGQSKCSAVRRPFLLIGFVALRNSAICVERLSPASLLCLCRYFSRFFKVLLRSFAHLPPPYPPRCSYSIPCCLLHNSKGCGRAVGVERAQRLRRALGVVRAGADAERDSAGSTCAKGSYLSEMSTLLCDPRSDVSTGRFWGSRHRSTRLFLLLARRETPLHSCPPVQCVVEGRACVGTRKWGYWLLCLVSFYRDVIFEAQSEVWNAPQNTR